MRLEACGYENIVTAENGREALEQMRQGPVYPVLLDIMMPELDCNGVLEELRTDTALRDVPVVMISAIEDISSVRRTPDHRAAALDRPSAEAQQPARTPTL
jgi:adenylate cyclase